MMSISNRKGLVILLITLFVVPASLPTLSSGISTGIPNLLYQLSQPAIESTPYLDYYLRVYSIYTIESQQIALRIVAEDPDGVDSVVMMHRNSSEYPWISIPMAENPTIEGEYIADFAFEFKDLNLSSGIFPPRGKYRDVHEVMYFANDSLSNEAMTEVLTYETIWAGVNTVDSTVELVDTPDMQYVLGTTDNTLIWIAAYNPDSTGTYYLHRDSYLIECSTWDDTEIETNVDGLGVGSYIFTMYAEFSLGYDMDNATVSVIEEISSSSTSSISSTFTTSAVPITTENQEDIEYFGTIELGIMIGAIMTIIIVMIPYLWYRKSRK